MRYFQCKCGECTAWSSMGVERCTVCSKCGSTLAEGPNSHLEPQPHKFVTKYDQNTGKPYEICLNCSRKKEELENKKG